MGATLAISRLLSLLTTVEMLDCEEWRLEISSSNLFWFFIWRPSFSEFHLSDAISVVEAFETEIDRFSILKLTVSRTDRFSIK
jgi:hypothetical protein